VDGQDRVEEVGKPDSMGFRDQTEQMAVTIEAPGPALLRDLDARLITPAQQLMVDPARGLFEGKLQRLRPVPLHADDCHQRVGDNPPLTAALGCRSSRRLMNRSCAPQLT